MIANERIKTMEKDIRDEEAQIKKLKFEEV
jgi:hypothetical protein